MTSTCSVAVCSLPVKAKGLCQAHYARALKNGGDPGSSPINQQVKNRGCIFPACGNRHYSHGYCSGHWAQNKNGRTLTPLKVRNNLSARNGEGERQCGTCRTWIHPSAFHKASNTSDGLGSACKDCRKSQKLLANFNMTEDEYQSMLSRQGGGCALCGGQSRDGQRLSVDHDHRCCLDKGRSCGRCVRGLLCDDCNRALGLLRDNRRTLRNAIAYLDGC